MLRKDATERILAWERDPTPENLEAVSAAGSPEAILNLFASRELAARQEAQETRELLDETTEKLREILGGGSQIAAFIRPGPTCEDGVPTAIIDLGGSRAVVPVGEVVPLDEMRENPAILLSPVGSVIGTLPGYAPPAETGTVVEAAENHLLVEFFGETQSRVDLPAPLAGAFEVGDRALVDRKHGLAVERRPAEQGADEWRIEVSPPERFADVASQEEAIAKITERILWPIERPELLETFRLGRQAGILLHGPSGCGKTLLGRATAGEIHARFGLDSAFLRVKAGSLKSKWYGETTQRISKLWSFARKEAERGKLVVLFIDEVDSLGGSRTGLERSYGSSADRDATNSLLAEMEGFDTDRRLPIVTIASTNLPEALDSAFMGRFGLHLSVNRPDANGTCRMFEIHLSEEVPTEAPLPEMTRLATDYIFDPDLNPVLLATLRNGRETEVVRRSHLVTGRMIRDVVEQSKWEAVRETMTRGAPPKIRLAHLLGSIRDHFAALSQKLTPDNVGEYVDAPNLQGGQVTRLEPMHV